MKKCKKPKKSLLNQFKNEYRDLIDVQRPLVIEQLQNARAMGDLSENADYDAFCVFDADNVVHKDFFEWHLFFDDTAMMKVAVEGNKCNHDISCETALDVNGSTGCNQAQKVIV